MIRLLQVICLFLFTSSISLGLSEMTAESSFAAQVEMAAHEFAAANDGKAPSSWEDLQPFFSKNIDEVFPQILPTKRYAFLPKPIPVHPTSDVEILVIARKPMRDFNSYRTWYGSRSSELGEPTRYTLTRSKSQGFLRKRLSEVAVQRIFRDANAALPEPDHQPERQYLTDFRRKETAKWILIAGLPCILLVVWWISRMMRETSTEST